MRSFSDTTKLIHLQNNVLNHNVLHFTCHGYSTLRNVWLQTVGSIHTLKENAEALVAVTREIGLEVSGHKTKYMVMSRDQNAGRIHSVRIDNSTFESVEEFKYLGTTLTNQNSIAEETKSRLRPGNACYH